MSTSYRCSICHEFWGLQLFNIKKGVCADCEGEEELEDSEPEELSEEDE